MGSAERGGNERREFLRACGCALAGIAVVGIAPVLSGCEFSHELAATAPDRDGDGKVVEVDVSALTTDNTALMTDERGPDRKRIAVVRIAAGSYLALSTQCTHSGFPVDVDGTRFRCTGGQGHNSHFALDGEPIDGPAVPFGPLRKYPSTYDAGRHVLKITVG